MTTTAPSSVPADAGDESRVDPGRRRDDPEERGSLSIADKVVERVAGYAVTLVPNATAGPRRVLGLNVGESRPEKAADVNATVHGGVVVVDATVAIRWPHSVREVAAQTRRRIRGEVELHTGLTVAHIDLEVISLDVSEKKRRRVR